MIKMIERETDVYWDRLWKRDDYYAYHDIPVETDGISQLLLESLKYARPGQRILEVGSGPGTRTVPLAKMLGLELTLVDRLESAHILARKRAERYGMDCKYVLGDAVKIPLDEVFDYVVSIGLNEHFFGDERYRAFDEQYRLTREGGRTVVVVPNRLGVIRAEQILKELLGSWSYGPTNLFTHDELLEKMNALDFLHVEMYGVSVVTSLVRFLPQEMQRKIFGDNNLWKRLTGLPGNFDLDSRMNRYFGEEIMAVGYK